MTSAAVPECVRRSQVTLVFLAWTCVLCSVSSLAYGSQGPHLIQNCRSAHCTSKVGKRFKDGGLEEMHDHMQGTTGQGFVAILKPAQALCVEGYTGVIVVCCIGTSPDKACMIITMIVPCSRPQSLH